MYSSIAMILASSHIRQNESNITVIYIYIYIFIFLVAFNHINPFVVKSHKVARKVAACMLRSICTKQKLNCVCW